jgi:hypothetical protein
MMSCTSFCEPEANGDAEDAGAREEERDVDANLAQSRERDHREYPDGNDAPDPDFDIGLLSRRS